MTQNPREDELAFEQRLLAAGLAEALPQERTEAALLRFTAGVTALQGGVMSAAALADAAATAAIAKPWLRRAAVGKWLTLGALAGSAATFAWLRHTQEPAVGARAASAASAPVVRTTTLSRPLAPVSVANAVDAKSSASTLETARPQRASAPPVHRLVEKARPDLAAEVAALDGIRTAISIGALDDAELKLADYRRRFTQGSLRSDAAVLGVEVLVARGRTQAAVSAAARFISQHPRDPQVARVLELVE